MARVSVITAAALMSMFLLVLVPISAQKFDVTVAADDSGNYKTINEAVANAPLHSKVPYTIHIKAGVYQEYVFIPKNMTNIVLVGDGAKTTKITGNRSAGGGFKTHETATVVVKADGFVAKYITFENAAPPSEDQAAAFMIEANRSALYQCDFLGHQDTLYAKKGSQFFRDCNIYGTVDFIFGHSLAVFQNCNLYVSLPNGTATFTAQRKKSPEEISGYVIQNCTLTLSPTLDRSSLFDFNAFLGRPWSDFSTVIVMESWLDSIIDPQGWEEWDGRPLMWGTYREYNNQGPGSNTSSRVTWPTFKVLTDWFQAKPFTVREFLKGDLWLPRTGVPYYGGFAGHYRPSFDN
ncbi:hypothetical protein Tsubulata_030617 [Turnera subulata]|uniref:Pectinesterase n=1 Tax=Turnera subulata TaxID=218843 RepID=A0A9Q0JSH8_9ROSI|nr:hypothetical protein Tsubulata_030617 [Turnera subulata]